MVGKPRQHVAYITLVSALLFGCGYSVYVVDTVSGANLNTSAWLVLIGKTAVELVASTYGIAFLVSALAFLFMREAGPRVRRRGSPAEPPVGIIYLCCDDADWSALESLTLLSYRGPLRLVIHDDSGDERARGTVDLIASSLASRRDWDVRVLRRPNKSGGKAGAVNYTLDQTANLYDYFLLCDNDSTVLDPDTIQRALAYMESAEAGGVQFRSVPVADQGYCDVNRRLADAIGAFHAFLAPASRYGWMPFIGHNALLRTAAVQEVGGLTPDFFSDDLDLTVRLNLAGFRIAYAPEITMGEKHPPSYTAFRKRSYKWAYGCVQTLRAHWWSVVTAPQFSFAEKLSFFQFAGFYCLQCLLLAYLCFALLAVPFGALGTFVPDPIPSLIVGSVLVGLVYAPLLSFYLKRPASRHPGWLTTLGLCGLVYGGTDFSVFRGVTDALRRRRRAWIPTNGVTATAVDPALFAEAAFGLVLLTVPMIYLPELLYLPCWFLFAGKFLFGPALSLVYRDYPHDLLANFAAADDSAQPIVVFDADAGPAFERLGA
jgi:cellulose synthase/poly-beta-1,6-N-acetylglucosamine synthase-like glycosyltransferase